jgi:hypothetical protein
MSDWAARLSSVLNVYLERTNAAIALVRKGDFDLLGDMMRMRSAAFHNFRALDAIAVGMGYNINEDKKMKNLMNQIDQLNEQLETELDEAKEKLKSSLVKVSSNKEVISSYRSSKMKSKSVIDVG